MEYKDYYKILGVAKDATPDEIKKQYRRLAKKYHPDVSKEKDAEAQFKSMKEAYEVLKDPEKRKAYDQVGRHQSGESFTPPPGWEYQSSGPQGAHFSEDEFSDFFDTLFRQERRRSYQQNVKRNGQDQHSKITITLNDAFHGTVKQLTLTQKVINPKTQRVEPQSKTLSVKIPSGITQGQQIRLSGQGLPGLNGGVNGDLYLEVIIATHPVFKLDKKDVYLNLPVTPWEAALGEKIQVPTLGGTIAFTLPKGAQSGQKIRLKGRGLPGKVPGDQYIILTIHIPEPKTEDERALYQKMQKQMPFNPREQLFKGGAS